MPLPGPLRTYQLEGVAFLTDRQAALLADGMGLGKTVQACIALRLVMRRPEVRRALIVCPASLRLNWARELHRWAPELAVRTLTGNPSDRWATYNLPVPVLIASYDQVRSDLHLLYTLTMFDVVLLDEAQKIRNSGSTVSLACKLIPRLRSWALTGTPLENRLADLVSVYDFLRPSLLTKGMSVPEVHSRIRPYFLRRQKSDVLPELPPIIVQDVLVELSAAQQLAYDDARSTIKTIRELPSEGTLLALITKLKQICNYDPQTGASTKRDALVTFMESWTGEGEKVLVFSQYVETLLWLQDELERFVSCSIFHGSLSSDTRERIVQNFEQRPGPHVLLMSLQAGGLGLNLNSAGAVVMFDRWWNPSLEDQAVARAHRFGRRDPLHVIRFLTIDSVEERISEVLAAKRALFQDYVEEAESVSVGLGLSRTELARIAGLSVSSHSTTTPDDGGT